MCNSVKELMWVFVLLLLALRGFSSVLRLKGNHRSIGVTFVINIIINIYIILIYFIKKWLE